MGINDLIEFTNNNPWFLGYTVVLILQVSLYLVAASAVSIFYMFWRKLGVGGPIETRPTYPGQELSEITWALGSCFIIAAYFYLAFAFINDIYPQSWGVALAHLIGFVVAYDFYMYVTHRALHSKLLRRFHSRHHTAVSATPWSSINLHPIETLINYLPFLLFAIFTSVSLSLLLGIHIYLMFGIANSHGNYNLLPPTRTPILLRELSRFHQHHHSDGRGNFGFLYTHWDWLLDTRHRST